MTSILGAPNRSGAGPRPSSRSSIDPCAPAPHQAPSGSLDLTPVHAAQVLPPPISENSTTGARRTTRCSRLDRAVVPLALPRLPSIQLDARPAPDALDRLSGVTRRERGQPVGSPAGPPERSVAPIAVASASRAPAPPMQVLRCSRAEGGARSRTCESSPESTALATKAGSTAFAAPETLSIGMSLEVGDPPARAAARPNAINPRSCCARRAGEKRARPKPRPSLAQARAGGHGGRRTRNAPVRWRPSPRCRSPSSCRYGSTTSRSKVEARRARRESSTAPRRTARRTPRAPHRDRLAAVGSTPGASALVWALGRERRRFGRGEPVSEMALHAQHALKVVFAIQTEATGRALRLEQAARRSHARRSSGRRPCAC